MTVVAYTKIQADADLDLFWREVEQSFPNKENSIYLDEIKTRKSQDSIRESISALLLLSSLLDRADIDSENLILCRQEGGKPYLKDSEIEFSVSHSHGYAAVVISDHSKVGIDIETAEISTEKAAKLAERFFSNAEKLEFQAHSDSFLKLWTKKEAYAKMQGTPLSDLIVNEKKAPNAERANAVFYELSADGHPVTVCLEKPDEIINLGEIII